MLAKEQQDKETELLTPVGTRELDNEGGRGGLFCVGRGNEC